MIKVNNRIHSTAVDEQNPANNHVVASAAEIFDDNIGKSQADINSLLFNKNYDASSYSGMGKKYLLLNIVNNMNILTLKMFEDDEGNQLNNTIFVIQYDFDLGGDRETILTFTNSTNIVTNEYTEALIEYNKKNVKYENAITDLENKQTILTTAESYLAELIDSSTATEDDIEAAELAVISAEIDVEEAQTEIIETEEKKNDAYIILQNTLHYYSYNTVNLLAGECLYLRGAAVGLNLDRTEIIYEKGEIIYAERDTTVTIGNYDGVCNFKIEHYIKIPSGSILMFDGGSLNNGRLEGNNTGITALKTTIFTGITISGTWNIPEITTAWFGDAIENNKLKDVFALLNENILNTIIIELGNYAISASYSAEPILSLKSNLNLIINGKIYLLPNSFDAYYIFSIINLSHIIISGSGSIIGDKTEHVGETGQWGHGIFVQGKFITIKDLTIKDCWGDSVCVGKSKSQTIDIDNIIIDNCYLDGSRRQGISVTHGKNVIIRNCHITNIGVVRGHNPRAAIDIEPNDGGNYAYNINVENCRIEDCMLGIIIYGRNYYAKSCVSINNCYIKCVRRAFAINGVNGPIKVTNCEAYTRFHAIDANTVDGTKDNVILFENNIIKQQPELGDDLSTDTRGCAIYALKGDYCFRHNSIICTLPVFRFASGNKFIEDNDIECGDLFFLREMTGVRISGNKIKGNVTIPGPKTIFENNNINGLLKSTASYDVIKESLTVTVKINDKQSIIRGNYISNITTGNATVKFHKRIVIDGNRFVNVGLNMTEGVVANNQFSYNVNFVPDGEIISGILLKVVKTDFVNNTVNYNGSTPNNKNIYFVWCTKNIIGNEFVALSKIQYVFYHPNGCFISGNKITLPEGHAENRIVDSNDCTIIPLLKSFGTLSELPLPPIGDRYYIGCKYFATDAQLSFTWSGYVWLDNNNKPINAVKDWILGKRINTNVNIGETIPTTYRDDAEFDCKVMDVHAGDTVVLTGIGGYNSRTYALIDAENKLIENSPSIASDYVSNYQPILVVSIATDCRIIINFRNASNTPKYRNNAEIPYSVVVYSNSNI